MSTINLAGGNTLLSSGAFPPVRAASTGSPLTPATGGLLTVDGIALAVGDRVLCKDETNAVNNGIYAAQTGPWIRTSDASSNTAFFVGIEVTVGLGAQNAGQTFICTTTDDPIVLGTSLLTFASQSAVQSGQQTATSTTSQTIGTGSKTWAVQAGKAFKVNQWVLIQETSNAANQMLGQVTAYSGTSFTVSVTATGGSGTFTDWTVVLTNSPAAAGYQPPVGSGNITGPGSSTTGHVATYADGTGKVLLDGGGLPALGPGSSTAGHVATYADTGGQNLLDGGAFPTVSPQGYITATSGVPIITADVIAGTLVYYTPYTGNVCPVWNGSAFANQPFSEQTLTLSVSQAGSTIYDVFAFMNSGAFTIGTGPAWSNSAAGAGARGTGAGTTQLTRLNGLLVNAVSMTCRNGAATFSVSASQATYLGSIFIDTVAGQVTCHRGYGQSRKWGIWNAYNRVPVYLKAGDSTSSWNYSSAIRASNGNSANNLTVFCGLAEEFQEIVFDQNVYGQNSGGGNLATSQIGIGLNSTTAFTGKHGDGGEDTATAQIGPHGSSVAKYLSAPALGINVFQSLETGSANGTGVVTFFGQEQSMVLSAKWRA